MSKNVCEFIMVVDTLANKKNAGNTELKVTQTISQNNQSRKNSAAIFSNKSGLTICQMLLI